MSAEGRFDMNHPIASTSLASTSDQSHWQPRYLAYVAAEGIPGDPTATLARDRQRWPCGCMLGFIVWSGRKPA